MRFIVSIGVAVLILGCASKGNDPVTHPFVPANVKGDVLHESDPAQVENWFNKDPAHDQLQGSSVDRAYTELKLGKGQTIVVAVIDTGVDVEHEDLAGQVWVNAGEIPGNQKDDDGNGYVDDVHGWNFLGSAKGNINETTLEVTREKVRLTKLKSQRQLTNEEEARLATVTKEVAAKKDYGMKVVASFTLYRADLKAQYDILQGELNVAFKQLTLVLVKAIQSKDAKIVAAKEKLIQLFQMRKIEDVARVDRIIAYYDNSVKYFYNETFDPRAQIIGDDPNDMNHRSYGNNDVKGPDAGHGTHVSGIIGAVRGNGKGIDGVASNVKIMALRAVPNGDEYDKDVANAVRYAADNGAHIINMSFGKSHSPQKTGVDAAFEYAAKKGVLIVHAAGNDSHNNNQALNFPNRKTQQGEIPGWLEVGASSKDLGKELPAKFSNYGNTSVDLFAPGVKIKSTVPDKNKYAVYSGTSMASPTTAGVAALILSQKPKLTAIQLRELILKNVRTYPGLKVNQPTELGLAPQVLFETLSITGGVADALSALK